MSQAYYTLQQTIIQHVITCNDDRAQRQTEVPGVFSIVAGEMKHHYYNTGRSEFHYVNNFGQQ